jgi:hypothetical protein
MASIKLVVAIPTAGAVHIDFAYSLAGLMAMIAKDGVKTCPEIYLELYIDTVTGSVIHSNREKLVTRAIENKATHLLFLDDDIQFHPAVLEIMIGRRHPIVVTNYLIKTDAKEFVAIDADNNRVATNALSRGIQPVAGSGFGCSLFETSVFNKIEQPWFAPVWNTKNQSYSTEDYPFFQKASDAGIPIYLDHDASKLISHIGYRTWNWKEADNHELSITG